MRAGTLDQTYDLIAAMQRAVTSDDICSTLTSFTSQFGLTSMIAGTMPSPRDRGEAQRQCLLVSAFPAGWMERYLAREYVRIDPIIERIQSDLSPFQWSDAVRFTKPQNAQLAATMLGEAGEFALNDGFAVPMLTLDGSVAAVSLGGDKVDLPPSAYGMISMVSTFAIARAIELSSRETMRVAANITTREIECLKWAADGKTEWEISAILGISEHTADKHLSNARRKLKAANRPQAVANAIRLGLIH